MGPTRQPLEREERGGKALAGWLGLGRGREGEARGQAWAERPSPGRRGGKGNSIFFQNNFSNSFFSNEMEFKTLYKIPHIT